MSPPAEQNNQTSPSSPPSGNQDPNQTPTPLEGSEAPTSTPESMSKESYDSLKETVAVQGKILEGLPEMIRTTVSSVVEGMPRPADPPPPPAAPPEPEVTDDEFLTAPRANTETVANRLFDKRIAPLVPHLKNQGEQLFSIQYDLERNKDPETFDKLKAHVDDYFKKTPNAKNAPNAVATVVTHFKGIFSKQLIDEAVEAAKNEPIVKPAPTTPSGGPKPPEEKTTLTETEQWHARQLGLSDEDFLDSFKELKSMGRI